MYMSKLPDREDIDMQASDNMIKQKKLYTQN